MSYRMGFAALLAVVLGSTGCCCTSGLGLDAPFFARHAGCQSCPYDPCAGRGCGLFGGLFGNWGCGDVYWGDYASDPPDCCEPCDNHGRWIGPGAQAYYEVPHVSGSVITAPQPELVPAPTRPPRRPKSAPPSGALKPGSRSIVR